tara:strand:+ start:380 stop:1102 length:723 start_codon:yes stop_codon:yes gene_type:complete
MSKKIKIIGLQTKTIHFLFFMLVCSLIAGVIFYNSNFSQKKITLTYEINIKFENWKTKKFFEKSDEKKNYIFDKLYSNFNKKYFQEINYSKKKITLVSAKKFNTKDRNAVNKFEAEYDKLIASFLPAYIAEIDLEVRSILKEEYIFLLNFSEILNNSILLKEFYNSILLKEFYNNLILIKKSKNFEEYVNLKKIDYKIDYNKIVKEEERKISYTDLSILLISMLIIYSSFLLFFKKIKIN